MAQAEPRGNVIVNVIDSNRVSTKRLKMSDEDQQKALERLGKEIVPIPVFVKGEGVGYLTNGPKASPFQLQVRIPSKHFNEVVGWGYRLELETAENGTMIANVIVHERLYDENGKFIGNTTNKEAIENGLDAV